MIEHLATLIDTFPGAANQTRCFAHILNLVAKSVLRQFEAPKTKGDKVMGEAARELAAVFNELDDEHEAEGSESGGYEAGTSSDGNDDKEDDIVDDDEDGLPDERDGMEEDELASLDTSVKPIRLVLTKVSQFRLLFKKTTHRLNSSEAFPWPLKTLPPLPFLGGTKFLNPSLSSHA
jgi:hypothetical protein